MATQTFEPANWTTSTVAISASTTSAGAALVGLTKSQDCLRIMNDTSVTVFVRLGTGSQTAVTTDLPVLAKSVELFGIDPDETHVAVITASGTGTVYATVGKGGV